MPPPTIAAQLLADAREWVRENVVGREVEVEVVGQESAEAGAAAQASREAEAVAVEGQDAVPAAQTAERTTRKTTLLDITATQHFVRTAPTVQEGGGGPGGWRHRPRCRPGTDRNPSLPQPLGTPTRRPRRCARCCKSPT